MTIETKPIHPVTWYVLDPITELDYRCDLCGAKAISVHVIPDIAGCEQAIWSCSRHSAGGHVIDLDHYFTYYEDIREHLMRTYPEDGNRAILLIDRRIQRIRETIAEAERKPK